MEDSMRITVNGKDRQIEAELSVRGLLDEMGVRVESVAVERNGTIVPRGTFVEAALEEGDDVQIVTFVGGG